MGKNKIKNIIFLLVLVAIISLVAFYSGNKAKAESIDALSKYGYKISIIKYSGSGEPELVGRPILVYQPGLFDTVIKTIKGNYPSGHGIEAYTALMSQNWGVVQFVPENAPEGSSIESIPTTEKAGVDYLDGLDKITAGGLNNSDKSVSANQQRVLDNNSKYAEVYDSFASLSDSVYYKAEGVSAALTIITGNIMGDIIKERGRVDMEGFNLANQATNDLVNAVNNKNDSETQYNYYEFTPIVGDHGCISYSKNKTTGQCKSKKKTRRYVTSERKIMYPGGNIDLSEYYATHEDSGTAEEMVRKYAGTPDKIRQYFGITINQMDLDKYYVQAEVVQRVLEHNPSKQSIVGSYVVSTIRGYDPEPKKWTSSGENWKVQTHACDDGYTIINNNIGIDGKGTKNCKKCKNTCNSGDTYDSESCTCTETTTETKTETVNYTRSSSENCDTGDRVSSVRSNGDKACTGTRTKTITKTNDYNADWDYRDSYPLYTSCPCGEGTEFIAYLYGTIRLAPSYIVVSRTYQGEDANPTFFLNKATNSCSALGAKHCILDDNENCTGKYIYYIGPNLEKALVGPSSVNPNDSRISGRNFLYTFSNSGWNGSEYTCGGGATGTGVQHFFFIEIPGDDLCKQECAKEGSNTSEGYLKCAENYCEAKVDYDTRGNARKRKKNCLLDEKICNYKYGHNPGGKDSESVNSCNQSQIVKEYGTDVIQDITSRCNMTSDGKYLPNQKGVMVEPCIGDKVTDFDGDDKNDTIFDQRTYINKICKETVSFGFKDTSILNLTKGSGFTYPIQQEGDKTCTYFINLEQWKFDYASAPARDPEQRKRLLYLLDNFNKQVSSSTSDKGENYINSFEGEGYGTTGYENEGYDFSKTTIGSKESETLVTGEKVITQNGMVVAKKSAMSSLATSSANIVNSRSTATENKTSSRLTPVANDAVLIVGEGTIGSKGVNRYISNGTGEVTYALEKVCISTDGLATVTKAPSDEICYQTKEENEPKNVYAEDKYYTSFKMETDKEQPITATASVGKSGASDTAKYYNVNEACTYKITDKASCILKIEPLDGGKKLGDKQYESSRLKVNIYYDMNQSDIQKVGIYDNNHEISGEEVIITNRNNRSMEVHKLVGLIVLKDGTRKLCGEETIDLYNQNSGCNVGCSIGAIEETVYEIKSIGGTQAVDYYMYTSAHANPVIEILSRENSIPYEFMKPVYGSVTDGKRYIKLSEKLQDHEILFGYVTSGGDGRCNNYCYTNVGGSQDDDCYRLYKPADTGAIHDYCYAKWKTDTNGFNDDEDCFNKCTATKCPNNRNNLTVVENYCASYNALGYPDYEHCLNKCYREETDNGTGDYLFRSVNVLDPFPNSQESEGIFEKGDRIVGKNWKFLSGYITDDSEDKTSITGSFANTKVEYVIDMTPENIRLLRKDTKDSDLNTEKNKRGVYAKLDRIQGSSSKVIEEYRSQFIHNSDFTDLFQTGHGSIQASFNPSQN